VSFAVHIPCEDVGAISFERGGGGVNSFENVGNLGPSMPPVGGCVDFHQ